MVKKKLTISDNGIAILKGFEGLHDGNSATQILEPMRDPVGYWTLGYGSRYDKNGKEVTAKTPAITLPEALELLRRDVGIAETAITRFITRDINQNQYDALCSFIFNIGTGGFQKSRLLKAVNTNTVNKTHFMAWTKAKGVQLPGLVKRREAEYALYVKPSVI